VSDQETAREEEENCRVRRRCWRVWVAVQGKRCIRAVADISDVPTGCEAAAIVMNTWTNDDWDSEAFAYLDQAGNWRYHHLRDRDEIVLEGVEAVHSC
jgi:hypothetical protein